MTDRRVDALAEALHAANIECDYSRRFDRKTCGGRDGPHSITAAAILAALRPGWCGHEDISAARLYDALWLLKASRFGDDEEFPTLPEVRVALRAALVEP